MSDGVLAVAISDAGLAIKEGMSTEDMLRATMKRMQDFWLTTDNDIRLRGALGAVLSHLGTDHEDYDDLVVSMESLGKANAVLHALMAGVQVDLSEEDAEPPKYALMKFWREAA